MLYECVLNRWSAVEVAKETRWQLNNLIGSKHTPYFSESTGRAGNICHQLVIEIQQAKRIFKLPTRIVRIVHIQSNFKELEKVEIIRGLVL